MVISSCTASPEATAICGGSFGTKAALRQAAPVASTAALSAGLLVGGREVDSVSSQVSVVGSPTLVRRPEQPVGALNPALSLYDIYGIDEARLAGLQDLLLARYCVNLPSAPICDGLLWRGNNGSFDVTYPVSTVLIAVNVRGLPGTGEQYALLQNGTPAQPNGILSLSVVPWALRDSQGRRKWADLPDDIREAIAETASLDEEWSVVQRAGSLGGLTYPAGYDPNSAFGRANPATVVVSGTDRIFREPAAIPGTAGAVEAGGPLINERGRDRRVGAAYPGGATRFQEGVGTSVGARSGSITQSATGSDGQTPAHNEKKIGFPLPGADGQLDSDDQISQEQSDPCQSPCIQDILNNVLDLVDLVTDIWELTSDYAVEDYLLPEGNFRFALGDSGHPKDQIVAACIIQSGPVPQWYGSYFEDSLWVNTLYPRNLGSMQFTYQGIADRLVGFDDTAGLDLRLDSPHTEIRSFNSLIFPSPDFPAKEVSFQARAGVDCRLRVVVRRYQLPI